MIRDSNKFNVGDVIQDLLDRNDYLILEKKTATQLIDHTYKLLRLSDKCITILSGVYVSSVCKRIPKLKAELLYG